MVPDLFRQWDEEDALLLRARPAARAPQGARYWLGRTWVDSGGRVLGIAIRPSNGPGEDRSRAAVEGHFIEHLLCCMSPAVLLPVKCAGGHLRPRGRWTWVGIAQALEAAVVADRLTTDVRVLHATLESCMGCRFSGEKLARIRPPGGY